MKRKTIDIITLGCSKNLVDSEHLMRQLEEAGFCVTHDAVKYLSALTAERRDECILRLNVYYKSNIT